MSPEYIGSNIWRLLKGERVKGRNGESIEGPTIVRVHEFPSVQKIRIQAGSIGLEVDGLDFLSVVAKTE